MRLIAGEAKGRRLDAPRGLQVRPSGARLRESAFGILDHRDAISGARVLDLFAGTGALGLEALSRGATELVVVEKEPAVARILGRNVEHCGFSACTELRVGAAGVVVERLALEGRSFELVLVDPPYRQGLVPGVLEALMRLDLLAQGGRVLIEHARDEQFDVPPGLETDVQRRCGDSLLTLLQRTDSRG